MSLRPANKITLFIKALLPLITLPVKVDNHQNNWSSEDNNNEESSSIINFFTKLSWLI